MKAPNGKDSNLSEQLWLTVRTKAFKSWFGDWENDPANASKVVDENGEPLVVYHGTSNDFSVFDKNKSYQGLFWFSNDYNKVNAGYDGATGKGIVMPVFLKIKNAADWDLYDKYSPEELENMKYDGLLLKDGNETVVVAFEPNQIKSINNRGAFDNNNPDIYFQDGSPQVAPLSEQIKKKISDLEEQRVYENKYGQTIDLDKSLRVFKKEAEKYAVEERKSYLLDLLDNDKDKFIDEFGKSNIQEMLDDYNSDNEEQIESVQEALNNDDIRADIKNVIEDTTGYEIENSEQYHNLLRKYGNYIDNRINVLADILKEKGYKVKIDKSNMSESNYIYLPEQEVSIRLSEHTDRHDNDIDLKYSDSIEKNIKNIEEYFQEKFYQREKENVVDLTDVFEGLKGNEKEIRKIAEDSLNKLINLPLETATAPLQIQVIKDNIRHYNLKTEKKIKGTKNRVHKTSLSALEKIVKNAVKIGNRDVSLHNTSKKTIEHKKKVEQYVYFKSLIKIKIGEDYFYYDVKLITEQIKGQSKDLLDLYHIEIGKPHSTSRRTNSSGADISLAQNNGNVNTDNPRGSITVFDRQYWIELYSSADKSTLLHESTHAFLSEVLYFANGKNPSPKILSIKKQLDDWLGVPENNGRYSTRQQELFAKSSETYFREGKAPTAKLKTVFERFKKWLANIYDSIKDDLPKINDDVRELFDTILSRSYDVPDSNIYAGKEKAIKEVIKNINEGRASEVDGITIDDVYNLLNVAYVRKPSKPTKNLKQLLNEKNIYDFNELNKAGADTVFRILKDGGYIKEDATAENAGT